MSLLSVGHYTASRNRTVCVFVHISLLSPMSDIHTHIALEERRAICQDWSRKSEMALIIACGVQKGICSFRSSESVLSSSSVMKRVVAVSMQLLNSHWNVSSSSEVSVMLIMAHSCMLCRNQGSWGGMEGNVVG